MFSLSLTFAFDLKSGLSSGIVGIAITNGKFLLFLMLSMVIYVCIFIGVYYYCYEAVKAIFEKAKGKGTPMSTAESMLSGAIAGSAVVLATNPIWTINVRIYLKIVSKLWSFKTSFRICQTKNIDQTYSEQGCRRRRQV